MFKILGDLTKAVVGVAVDTPVSVVADIATMGGVLTGKDGSYTTDALKNVGENLKNATKPGD